MRAAGESVSGQALFAWPKQAAVGRPLSKAKIYEHARPGAALRALFVAQVEQITWAYKLAPESLNLPAKPGVPEIEVFEIALKTPNLDSAVARCIDRAIPYPILFELSFAGRVQAMAAFKRPSEADAAQWVVSDYFASDWIPEATPRSPLPMALDLATLYEQLLRPLIPLRPRPAEGLREQIDRLATLRKTQAAERALAARMEREKQFNRKVELNAQLRTIRNQLDALSR